MLPLQRNPLFRLGGPVGHPGCPKRAKTVLRDTPGALPRCLFGFPRQLGSLFGGLLGHFRVFRSSWELLRGVVEMIRHGFTVRRDICGWNLRAPLSIADCMGLLFGVGGSGRSPVESADPEGPACGEAWQGR